MLQVSLTVKINNNKCFLDWQINSLSIFDQDGMLTEPAIYYLAGYFVTTDMVVTNSFADTLQHWQPQLVVSANAEEIDEQIKQTLLWFDLFFKQIEYLGG